MKLYAVVVALVRMVSSYVVALSEVIRPTAQVQFFVIQIFNNTRLTAAGSITLGDILEILPFEDPIVVLELDGESLWDALESSLSTWPAQEGYAQIARIVKSALTCGI